MATTPDISQSNDPQFGDDRLPARFWSKVEIIGKCWIWKAAKGHFGYGVYSIAALGREWRQWKAHRLCYEALVGPVPDGLELDHTCKTPACVNPACLDPVTHRENNRRSNSLSSQRARRTHCPRGHEYNEENTHYYHHWRGTMRFCRACWPEANRRAKQRRMERNATSISD